MYKNNNNEYMNCRGFNPWRISILLLLIYPLIGWTRVFRKLDDTEHKSVYFTLFIVRRNV